MVHFYKQLHLMGSLLVLLCLCACNPKLVEGDPVVIDSVSPTAGELAGGTTITISGSGLGFVESIYLGSELCINIEIYSDSQVTCETPAQSAGTVDLTVNGKAKKTGSLVGAYTYQGGPTVSQISPSYSVLAGGGTLVITGAGFLTGATVSVGGLNCPVTSSSSSSISCTIPARSAGAKSVVVVNPDSQSVTSGQSITYVAAPTISNISPAGGALAGGTTVTIIGTGFISTSSVSVDGVACTTVGYVNATMLTCVTPGPAGAGTVAISVTNTTPISQTVSFPSSFTYQAAPTITSISSTGGSINGGSQTILTGTGFVDGATVAIGTSSCTGGNGYYSSTTFYCMTGPKTAGTYDVTITNPDGQIGTLPAAYTYRPAPTVTSVSPSIVPASIATPITITGTGFIAGATVKIGASLTCSSPTVVSATSMTCTTPISTAVGSYFVRVTNIDSQYGGLASGVTYQAAPTVTAVTPNVGSTLGGTTISITGTGFLTGATVLVGTSACTGVTFTSSTTISCTTSAGASGAVAVTVTNTDSQSGALASAFTYQTPATLDWDISGTHPSNPDNYGTTTTNVTHTYYLKNTGDVATSTITTSLSGANPTSWTKGTDNCNNTTLAAGASCTVDLTFLGLTSIPGSYSASLDATATSGGSVSNLLDATRGP